MRAYARFHAAWWDDPTLGTTVGAWPDIEAYRQRFADELARFVERRGDGLPPARHQLYRRLLEALPRLSARQHSRRNLTIVHGDAHVWNCLVPKDGGDDVRLFDWDSWRVGIATTDLAYMMAMH